MSVEKLAVIVGWIGMWVFCYFSVLNSDIMLGICGVVSCGLLSVWGIKYDED